VIMKEDYIGSRIAPCSRVGVGVGAVVVIVVVERSGVLLIQVVI